MFIAQAAIDDKADVFLIVGDLFDRAQVEPAHLRQAQEVLTLLKQAGIPVVAVEGNHDKAFVHSTDQTWMQYLAEDKLLVLLRPKFDAEGAILDPWAEEAGTGAWIEVGGVRFIGAGYLGAATPAKVRQIVARLDGDAPKVLLLHAGPDYFVGEGGGFSRADLKELEDKICYLALGHIHKPMIYGEWACNPGSPENCELREAANTRTSAGAVVERGYAVVEIDVEKPARPVKIDVRSNPRRDVYRVILDCTPFGSKTKNGAAALVAAAAKEIAQVKATPDAVIDLCLTGNLNLNRIALDQNLASAEIRSAVGVFAVSIDTTRLNIGEGFGALGAVGSASMPRDELERRAIRKLVDDSSSWGLDDDRERIADLFYELKESIRHGRESPELSDQIATSPLVEAIRAARATETDLLVAATPPESADGDKL